MQSVALLSFVLLGFFLFLTYSSKAEASSILTNELNPTDEDQKINVGDFLRQLVNMEEELEARREIMAGSTKRGGLDLGLSRGFSGSQAAKHMMGIAAANYAGGPGRRRRSTSQ